MNKIAQRQRVKHVMSRDIVSISSAGNIHEALALMVENRVSALPVVDRREHCVGILTTTDLIDLTRELDDDIYEMDTVDPSSRRWIVDKLGKSVGNEPVASYMSENVSTVSRETTLVSAARNMLRDRVHHLPVVDQKDQLIGIVSTVDLLTGFAELDT